MLQVLKRGRIILTKDAIGKLWIRFVFYRYARFILPVRPPVGRRHV